MLRRILLIALLVILTQGCSTQKRLIRTGDSQISEENIARIHEGMTKEEVMSVLGKPSFRQSIPPIGESWIYSASETMVVVPPIYKIFAPPVSYTTAKSISIQFNDQGIAQTIARTDIDPNATMAIETVA